MSSGEEENKGKFFVIMPFGKKEEICPISFDVIYKKFIKPALKGLKYDCERADDSEFRAGNIMRKILYLLCDPKNFVLADLTGKSPNVLYELGIRHALVNSGTILITQNLEDVPFDLRHYPIIQYNWNLEEEDKFKKEIEQLLGSSPLPSPIPEMLDIYDDVIDAAGSQWRKKYEALQKELEDLEKGRLNEFLGDIKDMFELIDENITVLKNKSTD